jgi:hypothetical protein
MNIFASSGVCFAQINLFEVMNLYFKISTNNLNIDDNLLVFGSCQCVPILFIGFKNIIHDGIFNELNLCVLGLSMENNSWRFFWIDFDNQDATSTGFFTYFGDFISELLSFFTIILKLLDTNAHLFSWLTEFTRNIRESFISCNFKFEWLTCLDLV